MIEKRDIAKRRTNHKVHATRGGSTTRKVQRPITSATLDAVGWTASLGAITAEALALRHGVSVASARGRLTAACRRGTLVRSRPLAERPALYTLTAAGARAVGLQAGAGCRVSPSSATHLIACATVAAALELCYPAHRVVGEWELRSEWGTGAHRPDLLLWPDTDGGAFPVAVEVELTIKAPRRLREICRGWARRRDLAGVLYLVSGSVEQPVCRAVAAAGAGERIVVVPLGVLPGAEQL